ncbi:MAG: transglutaminase-like cysteine peptidase [Proteobacteria bacterium]|nr:transglutaminase-like cysteine peptidase [Pseudomonadota bacterium]
MGWGQVRLARMLAAIVTAMGVAACQTVPISTASIEARQLLARPAIATTAMPAPGPKLIQSASTITAPPGFISFCLRFPDQCAASGDLSETMTLTPQLWTTLEAVNDRLNYDIAPEDDYPHYGRAEFWAIATDGYGDCEDYALTKRKILIDAGLPELALRIAVVITPRAVMHAVLVVSTDRGDYVLDNLTSDILPSSEVPYTWIAEQNASDASQWVGLVAADGLSVASLEIGTTGQAISFPAAPH